MCWILDLSDKRDDRKTVIGEPSGKNPIVSEWVLEKIFFREDFDNIILFCDDIADEAKLKKSIAAVFTSLVEFNKSE